MARDAEIREKESEAIGRLSNEFRNDLDFLKGGEVGKDQTLYSGKRKVQTHEPLE
ncbi:MAG: hypothetical protein JW836_00865 [Deltaproteobacteria bacterium]|nr:hypothetical protein [Deltaproteobacteria bacterium]